MAKTEVILTQNVVGLGGESDHVKVAAGYARNYLFPQGLAIPLTAANKRRLDSLRHRRSERETHELTTMTDLGQSLSKLTLVMTVKAGEEGKMFGSITAGSIADELKNQFEAIVDKRKIHLPQPIKRLGDHEVELRLHAAVVTILNVRVESSTPAPKTAETGATEARKQAGDRSSADGKNEPRVDRQDRAQRKPRPAKTD